MGEFFMLESLKSSKQYLMDFDTKNQFEGATLTFDKNFWEAKKEVACVVENKLGLTKKEANKIVAKSFKNNRLGKKDNFTDETIANITKAIIYDYSHEKVL